MSREETREPLLSDEKYSDDEIQKTKTYGSLGSFTTANTGLERESKEKEKKEENKEEKEIKIKINEEKNISSTPNLMTLIKAGDINRIIGRLPKLEDPAETKEEKRISELKNIAKQQLTIKFDDYDEREWTILHWLIAYGNYQGVLLLLNHFPRLVLDHYAADGCSPLDLALIMDQRRIAIILHLLEFQFSAVSLGLRAGLVYDENIRISLLFWASAHSWTGLIEKLLNISGRPLSLDVKDKLIEFAKHLNVVTPLMTLCRNKLIAKAPAPFLLNDLQKLKINPQGYLDQLNEEKNYNTIFAFTLSSLEANNVVKEWVKNKKLSTQSSDLLGIFNTYGLAVCCIHVTLHPYLLSHLLKGIIKEQKLFAFYFLWKQDDWNKLTVFKNIKKINSESVLLDELFIFSPEFSHGAVIKQLIFSADLKTITLKIDSVSAFFQFLINQRWTNELIALVAILTLSQVLSLDYLKSLKEKDLLVLLKQFPNPCFHSFTNAGLCNFLLNTSLSLDKISKLRKLMISPEPTLIPRLPIDIRNEKQIEAKEEKEEIKEEMPLALVRDPNFVPTSPSDKHFYDTLKLFLVQKMVLINKPQLKISPLVEYNKKVLCLYAIPLPIFSTIITPFLPDNKRALMAATCKYFNLICSDGKSLKKSQENLIKKIQLERQESLKLTKTQIEIIEKTIKKISGYGYSLLKDGQCCGHDDLKARIFEKIWLILTLFSPFIATESVLLFLDLSKDKDLEFNQYDSHCSTDDKELCISSFNNQMKLNASCYQYCKDAYIADTNYQTSMVLLIFVGMFSLCVSGWLLKNCSLTQRRERAESRSMTWLKKYFHSDSLKITNAIGSDTEILSSDNLSLKELVEKLKQREKLLGQESETEKNIRANFSL